MPQEFQALEDLNKPLTAVQARRVADLFRSSASIPENGLTLNELARSLNVTPDQAGKVLEVAERHARISRARKLFNVIAVALVLILGYQLFYQNIANPAWPAFPSFGGPFIAQVEIPRGFTVTIAQPGASTTYTGGSKKLDLIRKDNPKFLQASLVTDIRAMVQNSMNMGLHFTATDVTVTVKTEAGSTSFPVRAQPSLTVPQSQEEDQAQRDAITKGLSDGWYTLIPPK